MATKFNLDTPIILTIKMMAEYIKVLNAVESTQTDNNGIVWGSVYLDNCGPLVPGALSALKKVGLYRACDDPDYKKCWGYVRVNATVNGASK